ncbi:MAG: methylated-DNA--[protein]-cysteine S-methyltransferase [Alphaproteobacteria bacterium]
MTGSAALTFDGPLGPVTVRERGGAVSAIDFAAGFEQRPTPLLHAAAAELAEYFAGDRTAFDLPLVAPASPFQRRMRDAMMAIPYGETRSYGALAALLGSNPRAVGQACGGNPIPIVVPCHRVLAADGRIGGYSAGKGRDTKRWLLGHESRAALFTLQR